MTPEQREKVREVLERYAGEWFYTAEHAIPAIAAIMQPQWLPVAGLVVTPETEERTVIVSRRTNMDYVEALKLKAWVVQHNPDFTHYCELPGVLPGKGGEDAE